MRHLLLCTAALLATAGAASAQTTQSWDYQPELPSWATVVDFDSPLPAGFSLYGGKIVQGTVPGQYAAPAGGTGKYLITEREPVRLTADKEHQSVGFLWGSIDTFNKVSLFDNFGALIASFTGGDLPPANGDQTSPESNRYVAYTLDAAQGFGGIRSLTFESFGTDFEIDNVAFGTAPGSPAPVPEPGTLGLFAIGLGALGRRVLKRRKV
ncbi:Npun_F0296 family exosortase-dependent surface protein [Sphingomonas radiodurans]|uniref:Npun_F0296 family exosortase-dependent surface protein n=1 Tax=Sphingomonas radiodurans TaxID=2890321 RepID=UPI001E44FFAF|nr:PEP-CTERM sorting domain-containing protein [Sphingomonas radiodurans]WBH17284.1 PEP-CTERM sorting domain-containing protein [Sphingomonas radiodurans]